MSGATPGLQGAGPAHPARLAAGIADDVVIPFRIEGSDVRGRIVRLGGLVTDVIVGHDYPRPVNRLVGEAVALTALLGSALKIDGRFILQANSDGPVDLLVADYATPGAMRAYAHFDAERVAGHDRGLLGRGHLAMTVDQGPDTERYQGIVSLDGGSLADAAHVYFRQSEQIPSLLYLGAGELATEAGGKLHHTWRAGGIMIQHLPPEGGHDAAGDPDSWERAWHLMETVGYDELLDPTLAPERLLYRLFHEDGVRAGPARPLERGCRCSRTRIRELLGGFPPADIAEMIEDGAIRVTCEFCGERYAFDPAEFLA